MFCDLPSMAPLDIVVIVEISISISCSVAVLSCLVINTKSSKVDISGTVYESLSKPIISAVSVKRQEGIISQSIV